MHPEATPLAAKSARAPVAVGVLVILALGLAALAVRSVFQTASTEVTTATPRSAPHSRVGTGDGDVAPGFVIPAYAGSGPVRLDAYRGHPIVLNFWASWCPPCRAEASILESAYTTYSTRGVVFIGIDMQNDTWGESRAFLSRHTISYSVGRDEQGTVARAYRVTVLPTTYLISADGHIHGPSMTGGFTAPAGARELARAIEQLL
jgi:cytochrome c biogenesis protein CcmG, thiol:disulfide interchange protein DsbE